jgi:hypothetical protein
MFDETMPLLYNNDALPLYPTDINIPHAPVLLSFLPFSHPIFRRMYFTQRSSLDVHMYLYFKVMKVSFPCSRTVVAVVLWVRCPHVQYML